jgi:ubiquinone/menaquinone biosynthesis C-methylase UbiE
MRVDLVTIYEKKKGEELKKIKFEFDQKSKPRPAWIKIISPDVRPGFLRVRVDDITEAVYRAFGNYFYPIGHSPQEGKRFMAAISKDYDSIVAKNNIPWAQKLAERLEKLGLKKDAQVIDLGAGTGVASEAMADRDYKNITLLDYSPEMLAVAKMKPKLARAKFIVADVKKLNLDKKYDAVISVMLFNSIRPPKVLKEVLSKVKRIMKPGAYIALVEESKNHIYSEMFERIEDGSTSKITPQISYYYFIGRKT